ncbi:MAG: hypothetical protein JWR01_1643, partial [Subtercola sp.]|nr:hypothetical protein [Subtercola sp.]
DPAIAGLATRRFRLEKGALVDAAALSSSLTRVPGEGRDS